MDFGFSDEQELLRAELRKFLDQHAPLGEVRKLVEMPEGFSRELWQRMADLGWVGLAVPEAFGGAGLDLVTLVVVLEETGRSLFPSPLLSTVLAARAIERVGSAEQKARWLPQLADGTTIGTLALLEESDRLDAAGVGLTGTRDAGVVKLSGRKLFVPDAAAAGLFVVACRTGAGPEAEDVSLVVIERGDPGVHAEDFPGMDQTKRVGELRLEGVQVGSERFLGAEGGAWPAISGLLDVGAALVSAEVIGAAEAAITLTTEFAKTRIQFGAAIGRFQAVKHPLAEMKVDLESLKSLVYYASWALDRAAPDAARAVSRAKAAASEAFARIGIDCVQLHGAVGYTWEYDIQLYLKRSKWARPAFGDADFHYDRLASAGGA